MATHAAVVTTAPRARLEILQVPTVPPAAGEVLVRVEWTASTPLDMHQAESGMLVKHPQVLGDGIGGRVVEVGPNVEKLKVGDQVRLPRSRAIDTRNPDRPRRVERAKDDADTIGWRRFSASGGGSRKKGVSGAGHSSRVSSGQGKSAHHLPERSPMIQPMAFTSA